MKKARVLRIAAFALALVFMLSACVVVVSAAKNDGQGSVSGTTTDDIKELLGAISYNDYIENNTQIPPATEDIVLNPTTEKWEYVYKDGTTPKETDENQAKVTEEYGEKGVWLPSTGTITWTTDKITSAKKYNLVIKYYPVDGKATPVEKVLLINGEIPFAEARQISMEKIWATEAPYADYYVVDGKATITEGKDEVATKTTEEWINGAAAAGIKAYVTTKVVAGEDKTVLRFEMPTVWNETNTAFIEANSIRFFTVDIDNNEIRSNLIQKPRMSEYYFKDANGFRQDPFSVVFAPYTADEAQDMDRPDLENKTQIALRGVNEPVVITEIRLEAPTAVQSYDAYLEAHKGAPKGEGSLKIEAEYFDRTSSQTIYPISDSTSAITSPAAVDRTLLNTVGGEDGHSHGLFPLTDELFLDIN